MLTHRCTPCDLSTTPTISRRSRKGSLCMALGEREDPSISNFYYNLSTTSSDLQNKWLLVGFQSKRVSCEKERVVLFVTPLQNGFCWLKMHVTDPSVMICTVSTGRLSQLVCKTRLRAASVTSKRKTFRRRAKKEGHSSAIWGCFIFYCGSL